MEEGPFVAVTEPPIGDELSELRYEVMYLLNAPDQAIEEFKKIWAGLRFNRRGWRRWSLELSYTYK